MKGGADATRWRPGKVFAALRPRLAEAELGEHAAHGHVRAHHPRLGGVRRATPHDGLFLYGPSTSPNALTGDQDSIRVSHVQYHVVGSDSTLQAFTLNAYVPHPKAPVTDPHVRT